MSLFRYFTDGNYPVQGFEQHPFLKKEEYDELPTGFECHVQDFNIDDPEDVKKLAEVYNQLANHRCERLAKDLDYWHEGTKSYHVLMRWADIHREVPPHLRARVGAPIERAVI